MKNVFLACILGMLAGCNLIYSDNQPNPTPTRDPGTYVVCVGMENSEFAGACPGAQVDAQRMTRLLSNFSTNVQSFYSSNATYANVKNAMIDAANKAELFIFYYSGHGGQQDTKNAAEADGQDEYLCFYDRHMWDDEVWNIISKCKGRVMLIIDACHSETMYRAPKPITLRRAIPLQATNFAEGNLSLMVWSGCPDSTFSYGDSAGGKMTNTLLKHFSYNGSYDDLWRKIENDKSLQKFEMVQRTLMGARFGSRAIFR